MHDFATTDLNFDVKNDTGDTREDILSRDIIMMITMITMMMITMNVKVLNSLFSYVILRIK